MPGNTNLLDVWIYALPAEWDVLEYVPDYENPPIPEDPLSDAARYVYNTNVTGFWKDFGAYRVYNIIGMQAQIEEILSNLTDVHAVYGWVQENGADDFDYEPLPADVLSIMKDHIIYDGNGSIVSQTPPSYSNPNWGHVFYGQEERIFAGGFSKGFNEGFR